MLLIPLCVKGKHLFLMMLNMDTYEMVLYDSNQAYVPKADQIEIIERWTSLFNTFLENIKYMKKSGRTRSGTSSIKVLEVPQQKDVGVDAERAAMNCRRWLTTFIDIIIPERILADRKPITKNS